MTMRTALLGMLMLGHMCVPGGWAEAVLLDKIMAVVNTEVVTLADFDDHLALTRVFRSSVPGPMRESPVDREQAFQRLIAHILLRQEAMRTKIPMVEDAEVDQHLRSLEQHPGRAESLAQVMRERSLSSRRVRAWLRYQLTVLAFSDRRLRVFVRVAEHDIVQYYHQHQQAIAQPWSDSIREQIQRVLIEQQINTRLDEFVQELRRKATLQFPP